MSDLHITRHGGKRIRERVGGSKKSTERIAEKAFKEGVTHAETRGNLRTWVDGVFLKHRKGNQLRIYGDKLYVFHDDRLITLYDVPVHLRRLVKVIKDKRKAELAVADDFPGTDLRDW